MPPARTDRRSKDFQVKSLPQRAVSSLKWGGLRTVFFHSLFLLVCAGLVAPAIEAQDALSSTAGSSSGLSSPSSLDSDASAPQSSPASDSFPNLNIYLPEGEFDIRIKKLIKNVLFESQIDYKFVSGDISTFLRYKYYARNFTYKLGVFDTVDFSSVQSGSGDFERVRGGLLLFEIPRNYNNRYFVLTQVDGLSFGDPANVDDKTSNVYAKVGYQFGTPFDERLNSIVGETRGRITPVLTAYRDIGPQKLGFAAALTQGTDAIGGSYRYTKFEAEGLKRFDVTSGTFLITRLHVGSILEKTAVPGTEDLPPEEQFSVPTYELFTLGGRDQMKSISDSFLGSDEIHLSNEYFVPIFLGRDLRSWLLHWNNLYGIAYGGAGNIGFDKKIFGQVSDYAVDVGLGAEAGLTVRNYEVFLTVVYAKTIAGPEELRGGKVRFAIRTSR